MRVISLSALATLVACASSTPRDHPGLDEGTRTPLDSAVLAPVASSDQGSLPPTDGSETPITETPIRETPVSETPVISAKTTAWDFYRQRYDANGDGCITRAEYTRSAAGFEHLDATRNGVVSAEDFAERWDGVPRTVGRKVPSHGEGGPPVGSLAPGFRLPTTTGEDIDLAQFRGQKPVVLVFGSFT